MYTCGWNRLAEIVSLQLIAAGPEHRLGLIHGLDAFGYGLHLQLPREAADGADDCRAVFALHRIQVANEAAIDLDFIEREAPQIAERRIGGAKVVQCNS